MSKHLMKPSPYGYRISGTFRRFYCADCGPCGLVLKMKTRAPVANNAKLEYGLRKVHIDARRSARLPLSFFHRRAMQMLLNIKEFS